MAFNFFKNFNGGPTELQEWKCSGSVSRGDVLVINGSTQDEVKTLGSTGGATAVGVANCDGSSGDTISVTVARSNVLFSTTSGSTGYTDTSHRYTECLIDATSQNAKVNGSTTGGDGFTIVGYVKDHGYVDGGTNNKIYGYFSSCELD